MTPAEVRQHLESLGFRFEGGIMVDTPNDRGRFVALEELISAAILDYIRDMEPPRIENLVEWSEEWLVG